MEEIKIFENDEFGKIRTIEIDNKTYFVANDVAAALGYASPKEGVYKHVDKRDKIIFDLYTNGGVQKAVYINKRGLYSLISLSQLSTTETKERFLNFLKVDEDKIVCKERKEISFVDELIVVLKELNFKNFIKQYKCLNYKIDLYLPNENVAIEYDENNHQSYSYEHQELRQIKIKNKLKCNFIRVSDKNTNLENIGKVIKSLYCLNYKS